MFMAKVNIYYNHLYNNFRMYFENHLGFFRRGWAQPNFPRAGLEGRPVASAPVVNEPFSKALVLAGFPAADSYAVLAGVTAAVFLF